MTRQVASHTERTWRKPEWVAIINCVLFLAAPVVWVAYAEYISGIVRPFPRTPVSSLMQAWPVVLVLFPFSLVVVWRSYVHARAYLAKPSTVWRGAVESAAFGGGVGLLIMLRATANTWSREPFHLVVAYVAVAVGIAAMVGLVLGLVLSVSALIVIHLPR